MLGVAYYHATTIPAPSSCSRRIVRQFPRDSLEARETVQVLGLSYYLAGRIAEAIPLLEETRAWAVGNIELAQVLGVAYIQTRQPDKAVSPLAQAFGVEPDSAGAHLLAAQMMVRLEFHDMADEQLRAALALDPRLPQANLLLGQNAVFRNRLDEGIEYFRKELATNPGNATALYRLGEAYARQPDWDKAIPALQRSLWINPYFSGPYIVLGRAYLAKGQPATAEGMLRRAVEYDPNNKSARYLYGQVLQRLGRDGGSEGAVRRRRAAAGRQDGESDLDPRRIPRGCRPSLCWLPRCRLAMAAAVGLARELRRMSRREAGLTRPSVYGGLEKKRFIIETNGAGVALVDVDGDGLLDALVLNGTRLAEGTRENQAWPAGEAPTARLYRNGGNGRFTDITARLRARTRGVVLVGVRGRLRQRRPHRSVHDRLRHQRAVPERGRRPLRRRHARAPGFRRAESAGGRVARSSTTTATAGSICSCRTTCGWIWRRPRSPARA